MITRIDLSGPVPAKKNSRRNFRGVSLPSEAYLKWHGKNIGKARLAALSSPLDPSKPVTIAVDVTYKDRHRRDLDNALSSILDLLVDAKAIPDDCWEKVPEMRIRGSKGDADVVMVEIIQ